MPVERKTARCRWRWRAAVRAAAIGGCSRGYAASTHHAHKRSFFTSVVLAAAFSVLLASLVSTSADAYGIVAWTAAARGIPSDPDAFPGPAALTHGSHALTVDAAGNAYVAGTVNTGFEGRMLTIKYSSTGVAQWRSFVDAYEPGYQIGTAVTASAVAVDGSGNAYVAGGVGYSDGTGRQIGFLTVKYDQGGVELWRALGAEPAYATADALAIGTGGNVVVTGHVLAVPVYPGIYRIDYLTIKYDAAGVEQWRSTVSNATITNKSSNVTSVGLDNNGNSYLSAMTDATGGAGYLAVSYDTNGNERWRVTPKASSTSEDFLYGTAVDAGGNVYLTGTSLDNNSIRSFTIKYDSSGTEKWRSLSAVGDNSNAVAIDGGGNVYTAGPGQSLEAQYVAVTKYDSGGVQQWRSLSFGNANLPLNTYAVAVDATGRVYATGTAQNGADWDFWTISYSSSGVEQWRKSASTGATGDDFAYALKTDVAGNAYVAGSSDKGGNHDWLTIKYSAAGAEQWRANEGVIWTDAVLASGVTWSSRHAMAADTQGNVFVTGYVEPVSHLDNLDFLTVKFDANGVELWRASPGPIDDTGNFGRALATDASGSVYVTGSGGAGNDRSYLTIKYGTSGQELWRALSQNPGTSDDPTAIAVDASHNVYVTGTSYNGTTVDYFTVKYDDNGAEQWRQSTGGPLDGNYFANVIAVDTLGNVYVSGTGNGGLIDCLTVSYDPNGTERWRATCNDQTTGNTDIRAVAIDGSGNVYIGGSSSGPSGYDFVTIKYSPSGTRLWRAFGDRGDHHSSFAWDLAIDGAGNVHVLGTSENGVGYDYLTIKYDTNGVEQWRQLLRNAIDWYVGPTALAVDATGNVYVTGAIRDEEERYFATVKYDPAGAELWRRLSDNQARSEYSTSVALGPGNAIYVAGQSWGPSAPPYMLVQKLVEGVLPTTTAIASAQNPSVAGQSVTLTATISGSLPDYLPKGTVSFTDGTTPMAGCTAVIVNAQQASCNPVLATAGMHSIAVTYSGDNNNASSVSSPLPQRVLPTTTSALVSSLDPSALGATVTFTASVTGSAKPTGIVDFRDGATTICAGVALSLTRTGTMRANCATSALTVGPHSITAAYSGDSNNAGSVSPPLTQVVAPPPPGVSLTSSLNPSTLGNSVTFTANVTGQTPTGTVTFKNGTSALCSAVPLQGGGNAPMATCTTAALTRGLHSITAQYSGDANNVAATSPVLTQSVKRPRR